MVTCCTLTGVTGRRARTPVVGFRIAVSGIKVLPSRIMVILFPYHGRMTLIYTPKAQQKLPASPAPLIMTGGTAPSYLSAHQHCPELDPCSIVVLPFIL